MQTFEFNSVLFASHIFLTLLIYKNIYIHIVIAVCG